MLTSHLFLSKLRIFSAVNRRSALLAIVGILMVAMWTMILAFSALQKARLIDESTRELGLLNGAVAQHAASLLKTADTDLRVMDRWLQAQPRIDPRTDARFAELVDELRKALAGLLDLRLIDATGKLYYIPARDGQPAADVKDRRYFRAHMEGGERRLVIGEPVLSRSSNRWGIPVSWRLQSPVGGIAVVLANIDLQRLIALHDTMRISPGGTIALMGLDGIMLSRAPYDAALVGKDFKSAPGFINEYGAKAQGSFTADGAATGGGPRVITYQRLEEYPVSVLVTRGVDDMLAIYGARLKVVRIVAILVTLMVLAVTFVLYRSLGSLQTANNMLQHLATTDALTGVMSRRAFFDLAQREFARAKRNGRPTAVLALDIDRFKDVNDNHGHAAGDKVLHDCAEQWQAGLREQDLLGRIGGEEFVIVLAETPREAALLAAERLRRAVSSLHFRGTQGSFPMTVSIGLAMIAAADETLAETLARADAALLHAKRNGRDRVELADEPGTAEPLPESDRKRISA